MNFITTIQNFSPQQEQKRLEIISPTTPKVQHVFIPFNLHHETLSISHMSFFNFHTIYFNPKKKQFSIWWFRFRNCCSESYRNKNFLSRISMENKKNPHRFQHNNVHRNSFCVLMRYWKTFLNGFRRKKSSGKYENIKIIDESFCVDERFSARVNIESRYNSRWQTKIQYLIAVFSTFFRFNASSKYVLQISFRKSVGEENKIAVATIFHDDFSFWFRGKKEKKFLMMRFFTLTPHKKSH